MPESGSKFTARAPGYDLFLTPNEAVLALRRDDGGRMKDGRRLQPHHLTLASRLWGVLCCE